MRSDALPKLRLLILGGGAVVDEFYLPAFAGLGWIDHVWVADPSEAALARLTDRHPDLKVLTADFQSALRGAHALGIQAVIVALPNFLHEAAVAAALDQGFDVLCEKPLALTEDACARLAGAAERTGRIVGVGMTRRFLPSVRAARRVLEAGWIGDIQSIEGEEGHAFAWSSESGSYGRSDNAGVLANVGVHMLDLVRYLCGPLTPRAYTDDWRGGVEVNAHFELQTAARVPVRLAFSYTHPLTQGLIIRGARGQLSVTTDAPGARYRASSGDLCADVTLQTPYRFGDWPLTYESALRDELCDFTEAVVRRHSTHATPRDAVETARLIDWAYAHHRTESLERRRSAPQLPAGRIIVTGGTGFVGGHLIEALFEGGHDDVVVPIRRYQGGANVWRFPVRLQHTNLLNRDSVRELVSGARYVFHLAYGRDGRDAARVTVEGTKNVVDAAIAEGVECVVVVSTTAVFGDPATSDPVDETAPYAPPRSPYETAKAAAEQWALAQAARETRTRIVILNPSCVYGPGGKAFTELPARLLDDGRFCWIEQGRGLANYVYVGNLVSAVMLAATAGEAHGQRFIVSDGWTTWRDFFCALFGPAVETLTSYTREQLTTLARNSAPSLRDVARTLVASDELWRLVGDHPQLASAKAMVARVSPALYRRAQISRRRRGRGTDSAPPRVPPPYVADLFGPANARFSSDKARRVLGWSPAVDLQEGQRASRAWLGEMGLLRSQEAPDAVAVG